jgi:hypothetical protein
LDLKKVNLLVVDQQLLLCQVEVVDTKFKNQSKYQVEVVHTQLQVEVISFKVLPKRMVKLLVNLTVELIFSTMVNFKYLLITQRLLVLVKTVSKEISSYLMMIDLETSSVHHGMENLLEENKVNSESKTNKV